MSRVVGVVERLWARLTRVSRKQCLDNEARLLDHLLVGTVRPFESNTSLTPG